jgi:hypothetical protein
VCGKEVQIPFYMVRFLFSRLAITRDKTDNIKAGP